MKINFKNKIILAPMAGVNDIAFMKMCRKYGADIIYTGMYSSHEIMKSEMPAELIKNLKNERHLVVQLIGNDEEHLLEAAKIVEKNGADAVDINFGCPDYNFVKESSGAGLLRKPEKIYSIIKTLADNLSIPVAAKIRIGLNNANNFEAICRKIQEAGASAVAIHGRTAKQKYSGKCCLEAIKKAKEILDIPVIGNGDIFSPEDAKQMLDSTKCDSIMIGRASLGNPYFFRQVKGYLDNGKIIKNQAKKEKINDFLEYYSIIKKFPKYNKFNHIRIQALYFISSFEGSSALRVKIGKSREIKEIIDILEKEI